MQYSRILSICTFGYNRVKEHLSFLLHDFVALVCSVFPINRKVIVFCNYYGRGYGDNLAPIANEILRRNLPYELIWLVSDSRTEVPPAIRRVKRGLGNENLILARAGFVISNSKGTLYFKRRPGKYYIQTWHGGDVPTKLTEASCEKDLSSYYRSQSKRDSRLTDFVLSGSSQLSKILREEFWYPKECKILEYGTPRKDVYFTSTDDDKRCIRCELFADESVHVALYAPTFRMFITNDVCKIDARKLATCFEEKFGGTWIVAIRLHPNVANNANMFMYDDKVFNGTAIEDGQKLNLVADVLITDYSSIIEDFVIQQKPVFLYVKDQNEYVRHERPLRDFYFELPFDRCKTESQLQNAIREFDSVGYAKRLGDFVTTRCNMFDDGHASERVVDLIEKLASS